MYCPFRLHWSMISLWQGTRGLRGQVAGGRQDDPGTAAWRGTERYGAGDFSGGGLSSMYFIDLHLKITW
jgi:hypothetical protein